MQTKKITTLAQRTLTVASFEYKIENQVGNYALETLKLTTTGNHNIKGIVKIQIAGATGPQSVYNGTFDFEVKTPTTLERVLNVQDKANVNYTSVPGTITASVDNLSVEYAGLEGLYQIRLLEGSVFNGATVSHTLDIDGSLNGQDDFFIPDDVTLPKRGKNVAIGFRKSWIATFTALTPSANTNIYLQII